MCLLLLYGAGIKQVIIPARNMAEVAAELPDSIRSQLQIVPVAHLHEVLLHAFDPPLLLLLRRSQSFSEPLVCGLAAARFLPPHNRWWCFQALNMYGYLRELP